MNNNVKSHPTNITTNLSTLNELQLDSYIDVLCSLRDDGLPDEFKSSDFIFAVVDQKDNSVSISNTAGKVAILPDDGNKLETIYRAPNGMTGTFRELADQYWAGDERFRTWMKEKAALLNLKYKIPEPGWLEAHLEYMARHTDTIKKLG